MSVPRCICSDSNTLCEVALMAASICRSLNTWLLFIKLRDTCTARVISSAILKSSTPESRVEAPMSERMRKSTTTVLYVCLLHAGISTKMEATSIVAKMHKNKSSSRLYSPSISTTSDPSRIEHSATNREQAMPDGLNATRYTFLAESPRTCSPRCSIRVSELRILLTDFIIPR